MTSDDELIETLTDLGRTATPPPDPAFANRLDAHLRTLRVETGPGRGKRSTLALSLAGLAGVIVVAALSLLLIREQPTVVVMTAAAGTDVVLPGEAASQGVAGQELPDGTRIVVSPGGEAVVGGVVLGPGVEALVVGGRIEVLDEDDGQDAELPTTRSTVAAAPAGGPTSGPDPDRSGDPGPSTTTPGSQPTDRPATSPDTDGPVTSPTTSGERDETVTTPPTTRPTTSTTEPPTTPSTRPTSSRPRPEPSIDLTLEGAGADRIVLDWLVDQTDEPSAWRIEAVADDRVVVLAVLRDGSARTTTVARIDARRVGFRVVALDADGTAVLASEVVRQPNP